VIKIWNEHRLKNMLCRAKIEKGSGQIKIYYVTEC